MKTSSNVCKEKAEIIKAFLFFLKKTQCNGVYLFPSVGWLLLLCPKVDSTFNCNYFKCDRAFAPHASNEQTTTDAPFTFN